MLLNDLTGDIEATIKPGTSLFLCITHLIEALKRLEQRSPYHFGYVREQAAQGDGLLCVPEVY